MMSWWLIAVSAVWVISETVLALGKRSGRPDAKRQDRFSLGYLWIVLILAITAANVCARSGFGNLPAAHRVMTGIGLGVILLGLGLRWTAILTLKKYFTVDVSIARDHQLIDHGVYHFIRHPAYTGSLLSFLGLGLALSNWLSLLIIVIPITLAFLYRIRVEERALRSALGESYARYSLTTKRLIPLIY
jgi:protein-S-isoprenylcysteine O-methyltransferase Ste14